MGLTSWMTRRGPLGTIARQIGDSYQQIQAENPSYTPEQVKVALGNTYYLGNFGLDMLVYSLHEKQTGINVLRESLESSAKHNYSGMAVSIVVDELRKRGVPEEFIQIKEVTAMPKQKRYRG